MSPAISQALSNTLLNESEALSPRQDSTMVYGSHLSDVSPDKLKNELDAKTPVKLRLGRVSLIRLSFSRNLRPKMCSKTYI